MRTHNRHMQAPARRWKRHTTRRFDSALRLPHTPRSHTHAHTNHAGACKAAIKAHCEEVEAGEGRLADCVGEIMQQQDDDTETDESQDGGGGGEDEGDGDGDSGDDGGGGGKPISDGCKEEVMQFRIERNSNINKNIPLGEPWGGRRRGAAGLAAAVRRRRRFSTAACATQRLGG